MIRVYVDFTGQIGRVEVPGGPFANNLAAHQALYDFGVQQGGTWLKFLVLIDAYEFVVKGVGAIYVPTNP